MHCFLITVNLYADGAALFYTSVKDNKNTEILYKYLLHKLYSFPFEYPASIVDKDAVFV